MKDKEKQIKLLIKRISKIQNKGVKDIPNFTNIFIDNQELAEELLKYYQPKLPEDSVVLSREEYETYQNLKRDIEYSFEYNQGYTDGQIKGSQETAQKFVNETMKRKQTLMNPYTDDESECVSTYWIYELAKQCGVEIKE